MRKILILGLLLSCSISQLFGQKPKQDSLLSVVERTTIESEKVTALLELATLSKGTSKEAEYLNQATKAAKSVLMKVEVLFKKSELYSLADKERESIKSVDEAIKLLNRLGDQKKIGSAWRTKADRELVFFKLDDALESNQYALSVFKGIDDYENMAEALNSLGFIHRKSGNYPQALTYYIESYELSKKHSLPIAEAQACSNIGVVLKQQDQYVEALEYYRIAEEIYIENADYGGLANVYNNMGNVFRLKQDYEGAFKAYTQAVKNRKKASDKSQLGYTYHNLGLMYFEQGLYVKAEEYFKRAVISKKEFNKLEMLVSSYSSLSDTYLELKDYPNYLKYTDLAKEGAIRFKLWDVWKQLMINEGRYDALQGNYEEAYNHLLNAYDGMDTLDEGAQRVLTSVLEAHFQDKQRRSEIKGLAEANAQLGLQKERLEENQTFSSWLIIALGVVTIVLVIAAVSWFKQQRAYKIKSIELEKTNIQLKETMIGKEEKEVLLKEIHHRVKNNLQIIKSLARLQIATNEDEKIKVLLRDFEQRVASMALVHESLYRSADFSHVNVNQYYSSLIDDLIDAYDFKGRVKRKVSINIDNFGIDTLIPLGLLTNEIISNSLKYGLGLSGEGSILVNLSKISEEEYLLIIGDDGPGFDFEGERSELKTLGVDLIHTLVEQLEGSYEFVNENGAYYRIKFKSQEKNRV